MNASDSIPAAPSRLSCPRCQRSSLKELLNCPQTPCGLIRRRIELRGKAGPTPLAMGMMLFGLGFALIAILVVAPALLGTFQPVIMILGLLIVIAFAGVGLFFAGLGAMLQMGRQTELMANPDQQPESAMLCLELKGFVVGGYHYSGLERLKPDLAPLNLGLPASIALVAASPVRKGSETSPESHGQNADETYQAALLNLLAQDHAELWRCRVDIYLLGRRLANQSAASELFLRPRSNTAPTGALERELWDILKRWQREGIASRGPIGLSIDDLAEELFTRRNPGQVEQRLCDKVRSEADAWFEASSHQEWHTRPERLAERLSARETYQSWYQDWLSGQPALAEQLRQEVSRALSRRAASD